jgi:hypothetical protein
MLSRGLILIIMMLITACGTGIKPEQIVKVEQNFDKIKPGMTKKEVKALVGNPLAEQIVIFDAKTDLCDNPQCNLEIWALTADKADYAVWPKVVFDHKTGKVIKTLREEFSRYFD